MVLANSDPSMGGGPPGPPEWTLITSSRHREAAFPVPVDLAIARVPGHPDRCQVAVDKRKSVVELLATGPGDGTQDSGSSSRRRRKS